MKIRNGFVSNSSSSSFCIYGFLLDQESIIEIYNDIGDDVVSETDWDDVDFCELAEVIGNHLGLEVESPFGEDYYFGISWENIGKDIKSETRKQFEGKIDKIAKNLNKKYKIDIECNTHKEAWRDG